MVSEPSLPRRRLRAWRSAASRTARWSAPGAPGSTPPTPSARCSRPTCNGPDDCWFGGVGSQDALGERVGAFHLHWNGTDLRDRLRPAGPRRQRHGVPRRATLFESTLVGARAREPHRTGRARRTGAGAAPDPPDRRRRLRQRPVPAGAAGRSARRRAPSCWRSTATAPTSGRSAAAPPPGPSAPAGRRGRAAAAGGAAGRRRLRGAEPERSRLRPDRSLRRRRRDARQRRRAGHRRALRRAPQRQQQGDRGARSRADGTTTTTRLPAAGAGRGSAARIACPAPNECWMVTWAGWLFHYSDGTPLPLDTDPAFQGTIELPPQRGGRTVHPRRACRSTTRSSSRRRRSELKPKRKPREGAGGCRRCCAGPLAAARPALTVSFTRHPARAGGADRQARRPHRRPHAAARLRPRPPRARRCSSAASATRPSSPSRPRR